MTRPPQADVLLTAGWQQGTFFTVSSVAFLWNGRPSGGAEPATVEQRRPRADEQYVVISQTCDIGASAEQEPYVEAMLCRVRKQPKFLARAARNSARWFVVDIDSGLVVEAKYRVQIAKELLIDLEPRPWPGSAQQLDRFVRWLARRYDRPALPDALVEAFQKPIEQALEQLDADSPEVR